MISTTRKEKEKGIRTVVNNLGATNHLLLMFEPFQLPTKCNMIGQVPAKMMIKQLPWKINRILKLTYSPPCALIQTVLLSILIFYLLLTQPKAHFCMLING